MTPQEVLAQGRFLSLVREGRWEYAARTNTSGAVVIVPITADGSLIFVQQYRIPIAGPSIEFPAGLVGDEPDFHGEPCLAAARRELLEETGYAAGKLIELGTYPTSPGLTSEQITYVAALDLRREGEGGGDEHEQIEVFVVPAAELDPWLAEKQAAGAIVSGTTFTALWLARHLLPQP
mgnify:CR=1 FL=1